MERLAYYTDKSSTSSLIIDKKKKNTSENVISHYLIKDPIRKIRNKNKVIYIIKASYLERL